MNYVSTTNQHNVKIRHDLKIDLGTIVCKFGHIVVNSCVKIYYGLLLLSEVAKVKLFAVIPMQEHVIEFTF